jgi:hypothetical protein
MTAVVAAPRAGLAPAGRSPIPVTLGRFEAWRLVRHPLHLAGLALFLLVVVLTPDDGARDAFSAVTTGGLAFHGVLTFFAANLVTSRSSRDGSEELLASAPTGERGRTGAACLAVLGPVAVDVLVVVVATGVYEALGLFEVRPTPAHLLTMPLLVLGGGLLGVMTARWLPFPGAALLVMAGMVAADLWTTGPGAYFLGTYVDFTVWTDSGAWGGLVPGSAGWHAAYLACLCGMAAVGALLRDRGRRRALLALGALLTAGAVLTGWAQLP